MRKIPLESASRWRIAQAVAVCLVAACGSESLAVLENPAASRAVMDMDCTPVPVCGPDGAVDGGAGACRLPDETIWHPDARATLEECVASCDLDRCIERAAAGLEASEELVERCEDAIDRCPFDTDACAALPIVEEEVQRAIDACAGRPCESLGACYQEALLGDPAE